LEVSWDWQKPEGCNRACNDHYDANDQKAWAQSFWGSQAASLHVSAACRDGEILRGL